MVYVLPGEMYKRNDYDRRCDHGEPTGNRPRNSRDEIADAHNVEADRSGRASGYDDSLVKLLIGQDLILRYERIVDHRQGGETRKGGAGSLEQQQVEQRDIHALATGRNAPGKAAPRRTWIAGAPRMTWRPSAAAPIRTTRNCAPPL